MARSKRTGSCIYASQRLIRLICEIDHQTRWTRLLFITLLTLLHGKKKNGKTRGKKKIEREKPSNENEKTKNRKIQKFASAYFYFFSYFWLSFLPHKFLKYQRTTLTSILLIDLHNFHLWFRRLVRAKKAVESQLQQTTHDRDERHHLKQRGVFL